MRIRAVAAMAAAALTAAPVSEAKVRSCVIPGEQVAADSDRVPTGFSISAREAVAIARRTEAGRQASGEPFVATACDHWQVRFYSNETLEGDVAVNPRTGQVIFAYADHAARWPLARGSGRLFVGPWIAPALVGLSLILVAAFWDRRRGLRGGSVDIAVLLAVGVSLIPFARGEIGVSTPLANAALVLLFARLLWAARHPTGRPPAPWLRPGALLAAAAFLLVGRATYTALVSGVSDVGYLTVFGSQAILDGYEVYAASQVDVDAYGPAIHVAYLPFTAVFPLPGGLLRGNVEAARSASIAFDVLTAVILYLIGRRVRSDSRGHGLGAALAFAWAANPLGFYQVASATNDGLVGLLVAGAVLVVVSPVGRGILAGLAGAAKWVPFVLAPLFAAGTRPLQRRDTLFYTLGLVAAVGAVTLPLMPPGGPREIYDVALGGLAELVSPFSIWGLWDLPEWMRTCAMAAALGFAVAIAFVPRRRPPEAVAALAAAALLALQLALPYWTYFYVSWFLPCALVGLLARGSTRSTVGSSPASGEIGGG